MSWLVDRRDREGLWTASGQDQLSTTEAVLSEVGALLAEYRPDVCGSVAASLVSRLGTADARGPTTVWGLTLVWRALGKDLQARIADEAVAITDARVTRDVLDLACHARLQWLGGNVALGGWLAAQSGHHESCLRSWSAWSENDYTGWCLRRLSELTAHGAVPIQDPSHKAQAWAVAMTLLDRWSAYITTAGWHQLWNGGEHADESKIQETFQTFVAGDEHLRDLVFREVETGRGPVDSAFANGVETTVYIEFKRSDHARLVHGGVKQLPAYLNAASADTGVLVCVSFDEDDLKAAAELKAAIAKYNADHDNQFLAVCEVDARKKASASTL